MYPAQPYDRTARDFASFDARLKSAMKSVFPNYTSTETDNAINLMRWAFCDVGDSNDSYVTRQGRETWTPTMRLRKSAISLGRRTGYELLGASAATCDLTFTVTRPAGVPPGSVTIAAGTLISTPDATAPIRGETQVELVIPSTATTGTVGWKHAETRTQTFTSNGQKNQEAYLGDGPFLENSVGFSTSLGAWTEQDTLALSAATARDFRVLVDQNDHGTVRFGDGVNGAIPTGSGLPITYEIGGGVAGDVDANRLTKLTGTFVDSLGNNVTVTVTNPAAASGGTARETVNAARLNIPLNQSAPRTSVIRTDFEVHALRVPGVARALMLSSDETVLVPENEGRLYIVPAGGGVPSAALLSAVETSVTTTYPELLTFFTEVTPAVYKAINVEATIWITSGYSAATVAAAIRAALVVMFAPTDSDGSPNAYVDFGYNFRTEDGDPAGEVAWSDVFNTVRDVTGVKKVAPGDFLLNGVMMDATLALQEFPTLGTVTLHDGATGAAI